MMISENLISYIHSLEPDAPDELERLRSEAVLENVPIIRREIEPLLRLLLQMRQPKRILEIGTGIGYSALFMDSCLMHPQIVTMENYEPRIAKAREHLRENPNICLMEGDAKELLKHLDEPFGFVLLDGPKAQYSLILPDLLRLMEPGALLVADNVLQEGDLLRSRYEIPRRQRTIHRRMREFLWEVKHHEALDSALVPLGDGLMLCRKKANTPQQSADHSCMPHRFAERNGDSRL